MKKLLLFLFLAGAAIVISSCNNDHDRDPSPNYAFEARPEFLKGNDIGILVIHGFTGCPQSMREVAHKLNNLGYTVSLPLLSGHGTTPEDMETTSYKDWVQSVNKAYNELKPKVRKIFILGLSMGGTQTLYCAANNPVDGAIPINASVSMTPNASLPTYDGYPRFLEGIGSDIKKSGVTEWAYSKTPILCAKSMNEFKVVTTNELSKITCPILIFKSLEDHVVTPETSDYIFSHVSSTDKKLIELKDSYHVATLDNDQDLIVNESNIFIQRIISE